MWESILESFAKAFRLMGAGDALLSEIVSTTLMMSFQSSL